MNSAKSHTIKGFVDNKSSHLMKLSVALNSFINPIIFGAASLSFIKCRLLLSTHNFYNSYQHF